MCLSCFDVTTLCSSQQVATTKSRELQPEPTAISTIHNICIYSEKAALKNVNSDQVTGMLLYDNSARMNTESVQCFLSKVASLSLSPERVKKT